MQQKEFAQKVQQIKNQLYRTAFLYMGNEADALDMVSESVYKGVRNCKNLNEASYFTTWMTRILINTCCNELKRKKKEVLVESFPQKGYQEFDKLPLKEAVSKLPKELKEVIILRFFTDLTLQQTAEVLSLPRGTVTTRQTKALGLLKLEFLEEENSHE